MKDLVYWIWLSLAVTPGSDTFRKLIEKFYTECQALMLETCGQNRALAGKLAERDLLRDKDKQNTEKTYRIEFGGGDPRAEKARL